MVVGVEFGVYGGDEMGDDVCEGDVGWGGGWGGVGGFRVVLEVFCVVVVVEVEVVDGFD